MKSSQWKDCPVCGAKNKMILKKGISQLLQPAGYKKFTISGLEGYLCKSCGEIILTDESNKKMDSMVAAELASQDSQRVVASELAEVDEVAKSLSISRQRVHQMMIEGKIRYVFIGTKRYPIRSSISSVKIRRRLKPVAKSKSSAGKN